MSHCRALEAPSDGVLRRKIMYFIDWTASPWLFIYLQQMDLNGNASTWFRGFCNLPSCVSDGGKASPSFQSCLVDIFLWLWVISHGLSSLWMCSWGMNFCQAEPEVLLEALGSVWVSWNNFGSQISGFHHSAPNSAVIE